MILKEIIYLINVLNKGANNAKIRALLASCLCFIAIGISAKKHYNPVGKNFPIVAWYALDDKHNTEDDYRILENCGFNLAISFFSDENNVLKAVRAAQGTGIKLVVNHYNSLRRCDRKGEYANIAMFYAGDEPTLEEFPIFKKRIDYIKEFNSKNIAYVNLLPIYASLSSLGVYSYEDYIVNFLELSKSPFFSFDFYPFVDNEHRTGYFSNLEIARSISQKLDIPFWGFVMAGVNNRYLSTNEAKMRYQVFCNIAYGAQGIQYFPYSVPKGYYSSILDIDYKPTITYEIVRKINEDIHKITKYILGARNHVVFHLGDSKSKDTSSICTLTRFFPIDDIEGKEIRMLSSVFENGRKKYLMLVNEDYEKKREVVIKFKKKINWVYESKNVVDKEVKTTIVPGGYLLFEY